jgi:MoaA/NifB/PqqE/SkfB family radical SAM enzyme
LALVLGRLSRSAGLLADLAGSLGVRVDGRLRSLGLVLTTRCNLRCVHCYQDHGQNRTMPWEVARAALDVLLASPAPAKVVSFFGGEPLLEPGLIRRAIEHVEGHAAAGSPIRFRLTSNGTLVDRAFAGFLAEHDVDTRLSWHGPETARRGSGEAPVAHLQRLLAELRTHHPEFLRRGVTVRLTLSSRGLPHLADDVHHLLEQGVARISVVPVFTHDRGWRKGMIEDLDRQVAAVAADCRERCSETGEPPVLELRQRRARVVAGAHDVPMCAVCHGGRAVVDPGGEVYACSAFVTSLLRPSLRRRVAGLFLARGANVAEAGWCGELAADVARLAGTATFGSRERKWSSFGRCADCRELATCVVCPLAIVSRPGQADPFHIPDLQCAFNLVMAAHRSAIARLPPTEHSPQGSWPPQPGAKRPRLQ